MEKVSFEVYREDEPKKVVRLALVDGRDSICLVTKYIDGETEYTLLELNKDTGTFRLIEGVGFEAGLPLDGRERVIIEGFNDRGED